MYVDANDEQLKSLVATVAERTGKEASWACGLGC